MIIENSGLNNIQAELALLDDTASSLGFVRWQWEYSRATYDCKFEDASDNSEYYLRINTRATEGKLEDPSAVLKIEAVYIGKATFPHGLDYEAEIPSSIMKAAEQKLADLRNKLQ